VVGKPQPALFRTAASLSGAQRPLTVGDRLDTDIEGAVAAGMDSLLVLTGVSGPAELLAAPPERRPTYVAADLAGLFAPTQSLRPADGGELGGWRVRADEAVVVLDGAGDPVDALRLLCGATWSGTAVADVRAGSDEAREVLTGWGLKG
jgi:hypothetical protein